MKISMLIKVLMLLLQVLAIIGCTSQTNDPNDTPEIYFYGVQFTLGDSIVSDTIPTQEYTSPNWPSFNAGMITEYCDWEPMCTTVPIKIQVKNYRKEVMKDTVRITYSANSNLSTDYYNKVDSNGNIFFRIPENDTLYMRAYYNNHKIRVWPSAKDPSKYNLEPQYGWELLIYTR